MQKEEIINQCNKWLENDPFERTRNEITDLMNHIDEPAVQKDLSKRFAGRIQFG